MGLTTGPLEGQEESSRDESPDPQAGVAFLQQKLAHAEQEIENLRKELEYSRNRERQTAEQLRMSAAMFHTMGDTSPLGIFVTAPDGQCIHTNTAFQLWTGLTYEETLGDNWTKAIHPDDRERVYASWQEAMEQQEVYKGRYRFVRPDGTVLWATVRANMIVENGELLGYIGSVEDSTDLVQTREELQRREELLTATNMMANVGGWEVNLLTNEKVWTEQVYHIYELESRNERRFRDSLLFYPPEARAVLAQAIEMAIERGQPYDLELPIVTAKGNKRWVHTICKVETANGQSVRLYGAIQDISERKRVEEELRESKERFELAMIGSSDGYWDWNMAENVMYYSPRYRELIDVPADMPADEVNELWMSRIHPDDQPIFFTAMNDHLEKGVSFSVEHRVANSNGEYQWFLSRGQALRDADGRPVRMSGSYTDITRRMIAEEEVRNQSQILDGILANMPVFTYRIDEQWTFAEIRGTGLQRFGIDNRRLVGRPAGQAFPPMRDTVREAFEGKSTAVAEYRGRWKGELWCFVNYIFPDKVRPGRLIGFALDITERRRAEETLKENLATLRAITESTRSVIFAVDRDYRYLAFNSVHRDIIKEFYGADIEVGMNMLDGISLESWRAKLKMELDMALNNEQFTTIEEREAHDGISPHGKYFEFSFNPIRTDTGEVIGVAVFVQDISEQLSARQKLLHTLVLQQAILDSTDFSIIAIGTDGIIHTFNKAAERMLLYSAEDVVGRMTLGFMHDPEEVARRAEKLSQELGKPVEAGLATFMARAELGLSDEQEWTYIRKDGSRFPVLLSITALRNAEGEILGFLGMGVDITQRKANEQLLLQAQRALLEAQRIAKTGSYEQNMLTGKTAWTKQAALVFGLDENMDMDKADLVGLIHPDDREGVRRAWQEAIATQSGFNMDYRVVRPDGNTVYINGSGNPVFDENGVFVSMIGTLQDISVRKQYERDLLAAKEAADAANRAKSEFLANMSHEIRTPLNAVLGFAELLRNHVHEDQPRDYVQAVITSGKTLLTLINDILDLSKIEAGMVHIHSELVDVSVLIDEIRQVFAERIREKQLQFFVENPARIAFILDPGRLRQILLNLVGNAVKFTDRGHVRVSAVVREHPGRGRELRISVEDTGIGIPKNQQNVIFEAFRQQDGQSTRKYGGTGLGLTITKRLVEAMNGVISLQSEAGKGATFEIAIPEAYLSVVETARLYGGEGSLAVDFHNATVLIADDDSMNRRLLREMLAHANLRLLETSTGVEAVRIAWNALPRLVLMDLRMPGIDGYETVDRLRKIPGLESLPIILLTASALREEATELGQIVHRVLYKPIVRAELFAVLMEVLPYTLIDRSAPEPVQGAETTEEVADIRTALLESADVLPAVLAELQKDFLPLWHELTAVPVLDELEAFAQGLHRLGERMNATALTSYGETLLRQVRSLDVVAFTATLAEFLPLLETIEHIITDLSSGSTA